MRKSSKRMVAAAAAGLFALTLTACQQAASPAGPTDSASVGATTADAPAPFDSGAMRIAIVQQSGQGDYFQQYLNGTEQQAAALGVKLDVYDAQGDNAKQATMLDQAIASGVKGIIVRHGNADTLCPGVNNAIGQGIPVVIYDVEIQACAPDAVQTQQSDAEMASLVLDQMLTDVGANVAVGYVNVLGVAPLDRRDKVWKSYLGENGWDQKFMTGAFTNSSATDTAPMVSAAVQANSGVAAIYAPYDEFTKGTLSGLDQVAGTEGIKVYGADISNADIELMKADGSRWMATGATDPNAIGAAVTRTLFLLMAGEMNKGDTVDFPPILVTQQMLRDKNINNMNDLRAAEPSLNISDVSSAAWIPAVTF